MADEEFNLKGKVIWEMNITTQMPEGFDPPKVPMKVSTNVPAPGEPDMDWTEPCLERGTMMHVEGIVNGSVPVTRAWVKDEVLYFEGEGDAYVA